jgi:hypothetical protein
VGNAAVFDAGGEDRLFFIVGDAVALVMSNVTLQNGVSESSPCTTKYGVRMNTCVSILSTIRAQ